MKNHPRRFLIDQRVPDRVVDSPISLSCAAAKPPTIGFYPEFPKNAPHAGRTEMVESIFRHLGDGTLAPLGRGRLLWGNRLVLMQERQESMIAQFQKGI